MSDETHNNRWNIRGNPVLATVATNHARPGLLIWTGGVSVVGFAGLSLATTEMSHRNATALGIALWSVVSLVAFIASSASVGTQTLVDRDRGIIDQYRIAGATPRDVLVAYVLGPQWFALVLPAFTAFAIVPLALASGVPCALPTLCLATAALTVAQLMFGLRAVLDALKFPRQFATQAGNSGALTMMRGLVFIGFALAALGATNHRPALVPFVALAGALWFSRAITDAREVCALLDRPHLTATAAPLGADLLSALDVARWLGVVACLSIVFDPHGRENFGGFHALAAFGGVAVTSLSRMPSSSAWMLRWNTRGNADLLSTLRFTGLAALAASVEFVGVRALTLHQSSFGSIDLAATASAMTLLVVSAGLSSRLAPARRLGLLALGAAVMFVLPLVLADAMSGDGASVLLAFHPLGALSRRTSFEWAPFARFALAAGTAGLVVARLLRGEAVTRARSLAELPSVRLPAA